jgi:hypothetical protein
MSGILSPAEMAGSLSRTKLMSQTAWAGSFGIDERIWRGIRSGEYSPSDAAARISDEYRSVGDVFWSRETDDAVSVIKSFDNLVGLQTLLHTSFTLEVAELISFGPPNISMIVDPEHFLDPTKDHFGRMYKWTTYASRISRKRLTALKRKEAFDAFFLLTDQLLHILDCMDSNSATVEALRFKVEWDQFTMHFENMKPAERSSNEWRQKLEQSGFFEAMSAYNDRIPFAWPVPWTALAFASCLKKRELYGDLVKRLLRSKKFNNHADIMSHPKFDQDFSDVAVWLSSALAAE